MLFELSLQEILIVVPILVMSLSVHEFSHGWASTLQGDQTPRLEGRLTLNPLRHMDLWGTLMLLTVGFGWAKPVRIDIESYKNKFRGLAFTSLAGPLSNLLIAFLFTLLLRSILLGNSPGFLQTETAVNVIQNVLIINVLLFVFNLIPIPPLDGSRVVTALFNRQQVFISYYNRYGAYVLLVILVSNRFVDGGILPLGRMMNGIIRLLFALVIPELAG